MNRIAFLFLLASSFVLYADRTATTDDGKRVLLKDNGTWEYSEQPELIAHFKGTGAKETDSFHITKKPWHLKWKSEGPAFLITVKTEEGQTVGMASGKGDEDQTTIQQTGDFYLEITPMGPYEIWITQ